MKWFSFYRYYYVAALYIYRNDIEFTPVYFADANQCKSKDDPRKNKSSDDFKTYQDYLDYRKDLEGDRPHCPAVICIGI